MIAPVQQFLGLFDAESPAQVSFFILRRFLALSREQNQLRVIVQFSCTATQLLLCFFYSQRIAYNRSFLWALLGNAGDQT